MTSHSAGKNKKLVGCSLPADVHAELIRRQKAGGWRSLGAYIRAVLVHHVEQRAVMAERRTIYEIPATGKTAAESGPEWPGGIRPLAPGCCRAAAAAMGERDNGGGGAS